MASYVDVVGEAGTSTPPINPYIKDWTAWVKTFSPLDERQKEVTLAAYTVGRMDERNTKEEPSVERKLLTWAMGIGTAAFALAIYFVIILKLIKFGLQW